ncbi:MAG: hypothetical protein ACI94Y_004602 [Maribacter sp.]
MDIWLKLVTAEAVNPEIYLPIPINVSIPTGATYGFYITNDFGGGTSYPDCGSAGETFGSDVNIAITGGVGKSYPFDLTFNFRCFNGTVHYNADYFPPDPYASFGFLK